MITTFDQIKLTGTQFNYFLVCRRKLWFFSHDIQCEQESDLVLLGKIIHEDSYKEEKKEFEFDDIRVDWIDLNNKILHEVKKSDKVEDAHLWQLKYYLYYFKINGMGLFTGELNYPKLRQKTMVTLEPEDEIQLESMVNEIQTIVDMSQPPLAAKPMKICKTCSYSELCFI